MKPKTSLPIPASPTVVRRRCPDTGALLKPQVPGAARSLPRPPGVPAYPTGGSYGSQAFSPDNPAFWFRNSL